MPPVAPRRLAGFRFEVQPRPLSQKLPRMDIAVLVGFAAAGPLDLPVVIEDPNEFLKIFGDDLQLAWDARHGRRVHAHLGPAVRAFFRNGGRRCWVVRVADPDQVKTNFFPLPGMLECTREGELRPAFARARSPGSWFDDFRCATGLIATPITVTEAGSPGSFSVRLSAGTELLNGDLVRLRFPAPKLQYFMMIREVLPSTESPPDPRTRSFIIKGEIKGCFQEAGSETVSEQKCNVTWMRTPRCGSSPAQEVRVENALLVGNLVSPPDASPPGVLRLLISHHLSSPPDLSFSPPPGSLLKVACGSELLWFRVASVGRAQVNADSVDEFTTYILGGGLWSCSVEQPFPSGLFPSAEKLSFELRARHGDRSLTGLSDLGFGWANSRCWNALPDDEALFDAATIAPARTVLDRRHEDLRREAEESPRDGTRFPLAGSGDMHSVFLPLLMQTTPDEFLTAEHDDEDELTRDGLKEFSASLFLDHELVGTSAQTLLGEADFIRYQNSSSRRLRGVHAALEVEEATLIAVPDAVHVGWQRVASVDPPPPIPSDLLPHPCWGLSDGCDYEPKPPTGERPRYDKFLDCRLNEIEKPNLRLHGRPDALGNFSLAWDSHDTGLRFVLEEALRPDFSDARLIYHGPKSQQSFYGRRAGNYYYRIRGEAGCETSNWSDGLPVPIAPGNQYEINAVAQHTASTADDFEADVLRDVHRSLLRLCAARGDLFAVLSLPEHFRAEDSLNHLRLIKPPERGAAVMVGTTQPIGLGEHHVFSYGAMYHPWLVTRDGEDEPLHSPPDGAALGVIARRSIERGAWIAPANEPFRGVIALNPAVPDGSRLDLLRAQVNQIRHEPGGFLALSADTLSIDPELRPLNVRRLLILLRRAALERGVTYVFETNGPALRRLVQHAFEDLLSQLFVRGAFAGETAATSYQVVTDDSINPRQSVEQGRFHVDLKVAPSVPMSFITVRLVQTGERGTVMELI